VLNLKSTYKGRKQSEFVPDMGIVCMGAVFCTKFTYLPFADIPLGN
jgi:hypothetical protein